MSTSALIKTASETDEQALISGGLQANDNNSCDSNYSDQLTLESTNSGTTSLNLDSEISNLSHEDLCEITQSSLRRLIAADALLSDLPGDVTTEEVLAQVAVVHGQSITVTVLRYSESPLNVVIQQRGSTVLDLKKAIQRSFTLKQQRQRSRTKISWRYLWRTYNLKNVATGAVMWNNKKLVADYDVVNKSEVTFVKKLRKERSES